MKSYHKTALTASAIALAGIGATVGLVSSTTESTPLTTTLYYQVAACNSVGCGPLSNEVSVVVTASTFNDYQKYVNDVQAAAYYSKWVRDNPGEVARWTQFRDAVLIGQKPTAPVMTTKFGASLVDATALYLDTT